MFGILGSLLGFGGSFITKLLGMGEDWLKSKDDDKKRAHEINLLNIQFNQQLALKKAEVEAEQSIAEVHAASKTLSDSYQHDTDYGKPSQWAVNLLRLFRPAITIVLIGIVFVIYFNSDLDMKKSITLAVLELTSMALAWWFGDRQLNKVAERGK